MDRKKNLFTDVLVLDGGFSSQISRHAGSNADGDPLWSARFLKTNPEDIYRTHLDYLRAGADVISTNTYQASVGGFVKHLGVNTDEGLQLIKVAVDLALRARTAYLMECNGTKRNTIPLVAGSVGPYGAHLNDGSEYRGNYADKVSHETIREWHKPRINCLLEAGVDLLAIETIPCLKEAEVLVDLLKEYPNAKAWLSFSCKDDMSLAHGENFQMAVQKCWQTNPEQLVAIGVNCCPPDVVSNLFRSVNNGRQQNIPFVTYPNSGERYYPNVGWTDKDKSDSIDKFVHEWLDLGICYIGGCCRTYQEDISRIRMLKAFGISTRRKKKDDALQMLSNENAELKEQNFKLNSDITRLKKNITELKDVNFTDYLALMEERDARYTLYHENMALEATVKTLMCSAEGGAREHGRGDPVLLRTALERCREQLSISQSKLNTMLDDYADTVPRRVHDALQKKQHELGKRLDTMKTEYEALEIRSRRLAAQKKSLVEELEEIKERCRELERAGTPRPQWEVCADFIVGGWDRWCQLAGGLSSRDILRVLLKELGPAAETEHLEYFDGLGTDPAVPPYLRYEGKVRNLRLSRREVSVIINDIWRSKLQRRDLPMQDHVTKYFEERYQQAAARAEWAYNVCAGAERLLDEPAARLLRGALLGRRCERVYWALRRSWLALRDRLHRHARDAETVTLEDFEKVARSTFPLKNEVDIKNLLDVVRKQLKMKINQNLIDLDKLFLETDEGFDQSELARELYRQQQQAQEKYIREVVAELGGRRASEKLISVDRLKQAFAIVDPAIDHVRMERYVRWAFSDQSTKLSDVGPLPLRTLVTRLAAGNIERVGPRHRSVHRRTFYK
ncbi:translin-associated factor X-interacting protein 1-like [Battus philenor]|uniref:translin-associated factor X-interacting protein 1-like n=1 Tax=Battus philenor TaxID=42288 RepID=UPI0035CF74DD